MEPRARAGHLPARQGLLGVRRARDRLRPARGGEPRRARRDLPLDGADPVVTARGRALGSRRDRRRLPLAAHHDARGPLQPDEAKPRRRARSGPHHPRRDARSRPRAARVPAGARGADPDDGQDLRRAAERDHRGQGGALGEPRRRRRRHRRAAAGRAPLRLHTGRADGRDRAGGGARRHDPRRRGGCDGRGGDRRGRRIAPSRPDRARDPRCGRPRPDGADPPGGASRSRSARRRTSSRRPSRTRTPSARRSTGSSSTTCRSPSPRTGPR